MRLSGKKTECEESKKVPFLVKKKVTLMIPALAACNLRYVQISFTHSLLSRVEVSFTVININGIKGKVTRIKIIMTAISWEVGGFFSKLYLMKISIYLNNMKAPDNDAFIN